MRILVSALVMIWLALLPAARTSAEPKVALRGEGYVGYSIIEIDSPLADAEEDAFQGGGTGSASVVLDK